MRSVTRRIALGGLALLGVGGALEWWRRNARTEEIAALFETPLAAPDGAMKVYHLGHSLVGRDMPAMLAQLAGHRYDSQLGWGTSLREHWEPDQTINGFAQENAHARYRDAKEAIKSSEYDAVILTEMVEIADAVRYHDSATYLARWADLARTARADTRVYLYETWHHTNDPKGWLARIDGDLERFWQNRISGPAMARIKAPIYLIPAGQVMAAVVRAGQTQDNVGIASVQDLFSVSADGTPDTIHFNDLGAYLVALTHYAVLYHKSPAGLPHQLERADGSPATAPTAEAAARMQGIVWDVVRRHPQTGVPG